MPDIKTRDIAKGTIKTIDKSAVAAERMKSAFIHTKEKAEHSVDVPESSAEEYASNRLESGIDRLVLCQEKVQIKHAFFKVGLPCQSFCFFV